MYEHGSIKPYLFVALAFIQAGLTSGIIFGWPALETMFIREGVYHSHCDKNDEKNPCFKQENFFELIYTVGIFSNNAAPLLTGLFLDAFGPKWTNLAGVALFFLGCGLFSVPATAAKIPAFALLGFSGPAVYCSIMHLCNLFPGHQSFVLSFFSGTFSLSSFIFKVFEMVHKPFQKWRSMGDLFLEYIFILLPFFILGAFVWPNKPFEVPGSSSKNTKEEQVPLIEATQRFFSMEKRVPLYNVYYMRQFKSPRYWIPVLWLALENLNVAAYLGTVATRFPAHVASTFNLIWSLGFVAIPFFGIMMDKKGILFSILVTTIGLSTFSVLKLIPVQDLQYLSFVIVSTINVGMWGLFYSYLSQKFGFDNYGKLLGVSSVTVAVIGLLQYPITTLTLKFLNSNFVYMDIFFVATSALTFACPAYLYRIERAGIERPAETEATSTMVNS